MLTQLAGGGPLYPNSWNFEPASDPISLGRWLIALRFQLLDRRQARDFRVWQKAWQAALAFVPEHLACLRWASSQPCA